MLSKHRLTRLFEDTDVNIPVTIFTPQDAKSGTHSNNHLWFGTIKDCLGQSLKNSEQTYHFQITSINGKIYTLHCTGSQFMEELRALFLCKDPMSIRIDILEDYDSTWIIILKSDL